MESHEILQHYSVAKTSRILMMFKGGLSQNIVVDLGSLLQNRLGFDVKVRRMFGIFVELAQNVKNYSAETELGQDGVPVGIGILMLSEGEHHYSVNSGNLVRKADAPRLREECEYIKGLDKTALKAYHEERIESDPPPGSKGAGLGLIEITLKTGGNVRYEFTPYDDDYEFFSITASVEK